MCISDNFLATVTSGRIACISDLHKTAKWLPALILAGLAINWMFIRHYLSDPAHVTAIDYVAPLIFIIMSVMIVLLLLSRSRALETISLVSGELATSEQQFKNMLASVPNIAVQGYDHKRTVVFWNQASEKLYGYSREEALGKKLEDLIIPEEMRTVVIELVDAWSAGGPPIDAGEMVLKNKDGSDVHVFSSHVMQTNHDGQKEMFCLDVDLTEHTSVNEKLFEKAVQLEQEISRRNLAEEILKFKQLQLEQLNNELESRVKRAIEELRKNDEIMFTQNRQAAMGEMIGNIAHQWRQPLNNIGLIIQLLQRTCHSDQISSDDLNAQFSKALSIVMHMSKTIDDFRHFFAPDREIIAFCVSDAVEKAIEFVSAAYQSDGIRVNLDLQNELTVLGFPNEYTQVVMIILNNARDQLLECKINDPCVTVRAYRNGNTIITSVQDNGGGIPDSIIDKIFDPYFTTKDQSEGTGIGLYMSKAIIERHMHGTLSAHNINGGAEFRIEI